MQRNGAPSPLPLRSTAAKPGMGEQLSREWPNDNAVVPGPGMSPPPSEKAFGKRVRIDPFALVARANRTPCQSKKQSRGQPTSDGYAERVVGMCDSIFRFLRHACVDSSCCPTDLSDPEESMITDSYRPLREKDPTKRHAKRELDTRCGAELDPQDGSLIRGKVGPTSCSLLKFIRPGPGALFDARQRNQCGPDTRSASDDR